MHTVCMRTEIVTTLKRKATELLSELEKDKEPIMITQHGRPTAVLVDIESYRALQEQVAILEGIARGETAISAGETVAHEGAVDSLSKWLK